MQRSPLTEEQRFSFLQALLTLFSSIRSCYFAFCRLCRVLTTFVQLSSVDAGGLGFANAGLGFSNAAEDRPANAFDSYREQRSGRYRSSLVKPPPTSFA